MDNESHVCPWGQTLPHVVKQSPAFAAVPAENWLTPVLSFRAGRAGLKRELRPWADRLDISPKVMNRAIDAALAAQKAFRDKCHAAGQEALAKLEKTGQPGIVVFGRPYNVHDAGVNLSVMRKMREYYGVNVIPLDFLDVEDIDIRDLNENMYWNYGRRIIATARLLGEHPNLHAVYVTNFKCGPDSFVKHFIRPAARGKPFLTLQFDGHSNDAGMMTRCEAYLDSKGFLRPAVEVLPVGQGQGAGVGAEEV
jgi:predicted nucleotide-binding protein (sugar kinase/HSP70/actin superfamily)